MAFSDVLSVSALAALIGADGANLELRLFKSSEEVDDTWPIAGLVEADFDGYDRQVVAWTVPEGSGDGSARTYSEPFRWTKGAAAAKAQVVYSWALMLSGGEEAPAPLAVRNLPAPAPMRSKGASLEITLSVAGCLTADPPTGVLLSVEDSVVYRGRRIPQTMRGRWKTLRHALRLLWQADLREDARFEREGFRKGTFHNTLEVAEAAYTLRRRIEQLLGSNVSPTRLDTPLKLEIQGTLTPKV